MENKAILQAKGWIREDDGSRHRIVLVQWFNRAIPYSTHVQIGEGKKTYMVSGRYYATIEEAAKDFGGRN